MKTYTLNIHINIDDQYLLFLPDLFLFVNGHELQNG